MDWRRTAEVALLAILAAGCLAGTEALAGTAGGEPIPARVVDSPDGYPLPGAEVYGVARPSVCSPPMTAVSRSDEDGHLWMRRPGRGRPRWIAVRRPVSWGAEATLVRVRPRDLPAPGTDLVLSVDIANDHFIVSEEERRSGSPEVLRVQIRAIPLRDLGRRGAAPEDALVLRWLRPGLPHGRCARVGALLATSVPDGMHWWSVEHQGLLEGDLPTGLELHREGSEVPRSGMASVEVWRKLTTWYDEGGAHLIDPDTFDWAHPSARCRDSGRALFWISRASGAGAIAAWGCTADEPTIRELERVLFALGATDWHRDPPTSAARHVGGWHQ